LATRKCLSGSIQSGICPTGYFGDGTAYKTILNVRASGYNYVSYNRSCVLIDPSHQCPTNCYYNLTRDAYFLTTTVSCPTSYYWNGVVCTIFVGTGAQTCIQGTNWWFSSKTFVPISNNGSGSTNPAIPDETICRHGLIWNGRMCILCN
jgi:hypothetical protein